MAMRDRWSLIAPCALAAGAILTIYADTGALLYELTRPLSLLSLPRLPSPSSETGKPREVR